ncbi:putative LPS assembly protein LptD [Rhodohalobacter sp. 8-1]|uniref:putative LPS assembly protein LptD n=1 Tax=Rhodohalobacter sp. 8-1 TaxID=3131972 RepID=UPI0030EDE8AC
MQHPISFILFFLAVCVVWGTGIETAFSQVVPPDSLRSALPDTIDTASSDTTEAGLNQPPGNIDFNTNLQGQAQQQRPPGGQAQATGDIITFQASDSLIFSFRDQRKAFLYGNAVVEHESATLEAGTIEMDLELSQVEARSKTPEDTLSYPVLRQENQDLKSTRILFNYETEKGKFEVAEVQVSQGHLIGTKIKNVSKTEVFVEDGIYSSCPPDHMTYYIKAERMKIVDQEEIFFTNARLYILDIPYPVVFPFGYVPAGIEQRQSGLLQPTYLFQNTGSRGLGLQNLGWFQYFNENIVGQTSIDLFTSGTFFSNTRMQYRKTDSFSGSINVGYSREQGLEPTDLNFAETVSKRLSITHDQTLSPYANLNANINLNTSNYFQRNSLDIDERAQTSSTSRISYRYKHPEGNYNFSVSSNLNQQFNTNVTRLTGPEMSFSMRQFSPFESNQPGAAEKLWYENISVSYNNNFSSNYNFTPTARDSAQINWFEALFDPSKYREATGNDEHIQYGFVQRAQVRAGQLVPSQFLNVSANISFNEYWYPSTTNRDFNAEENRVVESKERGFAAARDFSTSLSFSTTFYGISQVKVGNFEGLRHTVRPNVSLSYRPDFSDEQWGFYEEVQTDTLGNTRLFSKFDREVFGGPPRGEQQTISFGLSNILETKRIKRDSTGEVQTTNIRLIDNFSVNSNYNFAADSLNFGQISMSVSSRVLDGIRLSASANYSVYARNEQGREINTYLIETGNRILQPLSYSLSASTSFSGGSSGGPRVQTPPYRPYDPYNQQFFSPIDQYFNNRPVQPINSSWSVGFDFSYRWNYRFGQDANKTATLNANNIQFNLTPKWSVSTRLGYDFIEKELTPAQFRLNREMICWNLSFQFNPFGDFQYYAFRLSINSGQIQSLFQKLPLLNNLERSSSGGRRPPRF